MLGSVPKKNVCITTEIKLVCFRCGVWFFFLFGLVCFGFWGVVCWCGDVLVVLFFVFV